MLSKLKAKAARILQRKWPPAQTLEQEIWADCARRATKNRLFIRRRYLWWVFA